VNAVALLPVGFALGIAVGVGAARYASSMPGIIRRLVDRRRPASAFEAVRADALAWRENQEHRDHTTFFMKPLGHAEEIGSVVMLVRYAAGTVNPAHAHSKGHGMYVLSGELVTHKGAYGPGTFVWFPAGELMWHGAGSGGEVVVLFVTGLDMTTRYPAERDRSRA